MTIVALLLAAQAVNVPGLPKDIAKSATFYTVLSMGAATGQLAVWTEADRLRAFYQYNDRGRGPKTYSTIVGGSGSTSTPRSGWCRSSCTARSSPSWWRPSPRRRIAGGCASAATSPPA